MTVSIVTFLWDDPLMQGGKLHVAVKDPNARPNYDMLPTYRQRKRGVLPPPVKQTMQYVGMGPARSFKPEHVVTLAAATRRNLKISHRFICVVDKMPEDAGEGVEWLVEPPAAAKLGELRTPEGIRFPSCYRRLWAWSEKAREYLGDTIMVWDIDLVPVRNMDHLFAGNEDFMGWRPYRDWGRKMRYGGGIYRMKAGSRSFVYDDFKGAASIQEARLAGFRGSDQAWISYKLAGREPYYDKKAGIYSIRDLGPTHELPKDAVLVQFNGHQKCWGYKGPAQWVAEHWRR